MEKIQGVPSGVVSASSLIMDTEATMYAKTKLGEARFDVLSKGLEFCRVVYGSDYTEIFIRVVYVCRHCGCAPACDFDCGGAFVEVANSRVGIVPAAERSASKT